MILKPNTIIYPKGYYVVKLRNKGKQIWKSNDDVMLKLFESGIIEDCEVLQVVKITDIEEE